MKQALVLYRHSQLGAVFIEWIRNPVEYGEANHHRERGQGSNFFFICDVDENNIVYLKTTLYTVRYKLDGVLLTKIK